MPDIAEVALTAERPWPGMRPYREQDAGFFFGRNAEVADLLARTERSLLTLLYGRGGLGKTSLVRAGLASRLVERGFLPVYLRPRGLLDGGRDPIAEVTRAIESAATAGHLEATAGFAVPSLWELFHRKSFDLWDATNRLVTPVLVFDQFEEIFQVIDDDAAAAPRVKALLDNIAELVENRMPTHLAAGDLPDDDDHRFDIASSTYRVILSFREDYLPQVRKLRSIIPSVIENHVRLEALSGKQALEVVENAGRNLIDHDAAMMLVRGVGRRAGLLQVLLDPDSAPAGESGTSVANLEVDPAILSVVCFYLNAERQKRGQTTIDVGLVKLKTPEDIFDDYYRIAVAPRDAEVRNFIESSLITASGERVLYPMKAIESQGKGITAAIGSLLEQGILRKEWFAGEQRLEISHDLLLRPIRRAVEEAKAAAESRKRQRRMAYSVLGGILAMVGIAALALHQIQVAELEATNNRTAAEKKVAEAQRQEAEAQRQEAEAKLLADHALLAQTRFLQDKMSGQQDAMYRQLIVAYVPSGLDPKGRTLKDVITIDTNAAAEQNGGKSVGKWRQVFERIVQISRTIKEPRLRWQLRNTTIAYLQFRIDGAGVPVSEWEPLLSELRDSVGESCKSGFTLPVDSMVTWFAGNGGTPAGCK